MGMGLGIGMNSWDWEGMGMLRAIPAHLYCRGNRTVSLSDFVQL